MTSEASFNADEVAKRQYGKSCLHCRARKKKCEPSPNGPCALCEKDGVACEVFTRRVRIASRDLRNSLGRGDEDAMASSSTSPVRKKRSRQSVASANTDQSDTSAPPSHQFDRTPDTLPSIAVQPAGHHGALQFPTPGATVDPGSLGSHPSPRSMATGHGSSFVSAMNNLVSSVCGNLQEFEVNEPLLQTYFVWQAPQHMPVDELLFRRDMTARPTGPYFSVALLHAIHAQASRHILSRDEGWRYADQAEALILASLSKPPQLTTIQALLILAGRDLALGQSSASWIKSGMAIRMMTDMGLERSLTQTAAQGGDEEDLGLRRRLFWSCYCWDKFFALTMGRAPAVSLPAVFNHQPIVQPPMRPLWEPYYPEDQTLAYIPQPSYEAETFEACCMLYRDIETVINTLYIRSHEDDPYHNDLLIHSITQRLLDWRRNVSPNVLLDTSYLPDASPPPHILTLNILYRTVWILFQRPFIGRRGSVDSSRAQRICSERSAEIYLLFDLHRRTFGLRNITYLLAYSAYVSATADVADVLSGESHRSEPASKRLELSLGVLTQASIHTPGIQRSIHHLRQKLASRNDSRSAQRSRAGSPTTAHPSGGIEAPLVLPMMPEQPTLTLFDDPTFGSSLDELFASLLPEYVNDIDWTQTDANGASTAFLPIESVDCLGI